MEKQGKKKEKGNNSNTALSLLVNETIQKLMGP